MNEAFSPSTPGALALRGIHMSEALARFAGDEQRLRYWLLDFASYGPTAAQQIRSAIADGAGDQATKLSHAFKGRSAMLGMAELHSIAQSLEQALKNSEPTDLWLDELESTTAEMSQDIQAALGDAGS